MINQRADGNGHATAGKPGHASIHEIGEDDHDHRVVHAVEDGSHHPHEEADPERQQRYEQTAHQARSGAFNYLATIHAEMRSAHRGGRCVARGGGTPPDDRARFARSAA
jgi:hypothetical protein